MEKCWCFHWSILKDHCKVNPLLPSYETPSSWHAEIYRQHAESYHGMILLLFFLWRIQWFVNPNSHPLGSNMQPATVRWPTYPRGFRSALWNAVDVYSKNEDPKCSQESRPRAFARATSNASSKFCKYYRWLLQFHFSTIWSPCEVNP